MNVFRLAIVPLDDCVPARMRLVTLAAVPLDDCVPALITMLIFEIAPLVVCVLVRDLKNSPVVWMSGRRRRCLGRRRKTPWDIIRLFPQSRRSRTWL